jgi:hypothetical protein
LSSSLLESTTSPRSMIQFLATSWRNFLYFCSFVQRFVCQNELIKAQFSRNNTTFFDHCFSNNWIIAEVLVHMFYTFHVLVVLHYTVWFAYFFIYLSIFLPCMCMFRIMYGADHSH